MDRGTGAENGKRDQEMTNDNSYYRDKFIIKHKYYQQLKGHVEGFVKSPKDQPQLALLTCQYVIDALDRESNDHAEDLEYVKKLLNTQRESLSSTDMNISVLVPVVVELAKRLNALESFQKTEQRTKHMREGFERFVKERAQKIEREKQQGEERIKRGFPAVK